MVAPHRGSRPRVLVDNHLDCVLVDFAGCTFRRLRTGVVVAVGTAIPRYLVAVAMDLPTSTASGTVARSLLGVPHRGQYIEPVVRGGTFRIRRAWSHGHRISDRGTD